MRLIFDHYLENRSAPLVARWLNDQGHRQKRYASRRKGETGGQPFSPAAVRLMIQNRLYMGEITHKGAVFAGQHDPIIDRDTFDRAHNVMEGNAKNRRGPLLRAQHDWPLTGVAECACGYALTSSAGTGRTGKTYFYYRCVGLQKNVDHPCEVRQVRAELLEDAVFALVREAAREPALLAEAVDEANRMAREHVAPLRTRVDVLRCELAEVEEEGQRTLRQILSSGVANSDLARKLLAEIEARRDALRASLSTAEGELSAKESGQLDLELVTQAIRGFDSAFGHFTSAEKREFLQLLIHKATVYPDRVDVELYDGRHVSRFLAQVARNGVVLGPRDEEGRNATGREPVKGFAVGRMAPLGRQSWNNVRESGRGSDASDEDYSGGGCAPVGQGGQLWARHAAELLGGAVGAPVVPEVRRRGHPERSADQRPARASRPRSHGPPLRPPARAGLSGLRGAAPRATGGQGRGGAGGDRAAGATR